MMVRLSGGTRCKVGCCQRRMSYGCAVLEHLLVGVVGAARLEEVQEVQEEEEGEEG